MTVPGRAGLYLDAARNMRAGQVLGRVRRLVPPAVLAAGLRAEPPPRLSPVAAGLGVQEAPQSGPVTPPAEDGVFRGAGAERAFPDGQFWIDGCDGLLFLFHLHGFAELARYVAGDRSTEGDRFWRGVV